MVNFGLSLGMKIIVIKVIPLRTDLVLLRNTLDAILNVKI